MYSVLVQYAVLSTCKERNSLSLGRSDSPDLVSLSVHLSSRLYRTLNPVLGTSVLGYSVLSTVLEYRVPKYRVIMYGTSTLLVLKH